MNPELQGMTPEEKEKFLNKAIKNAYTESYLNIIILVLCIMFVGVLFDKACQ